MQFDSETDYMLKYLNIFRGLFVLLYLDLQYANVFPECTKNLQ